MRILLNRHAAPFITSLFLVLLVWGSALFFHVVPAGFHGMHEWLSLLLILSFALHPWKNRRPMTSYLRHAPMGVALAASAALAEVLLLPGGIRGRAATRRLPCLGRVIQSRPAELASLLEVSPEAMAAAVNGAGIAVTDTGQPVAPAAAAGATTTMDIAAALVPLLR